MAVQSRLEGPLLTRACDGSRRRATDRPRRACGPAVSRVGSRCCRNAGSALARTGRRGCGSLERHTGARDSKKRPLRRSFARHAPRAQRCDFLGLGNRNAVQPVSSPSRTAFAALAAFAWFAGFRGTRRESGAMHGSPTPPLATPRGADVTDDSTKSGRSGPCAERPRAAYSDPAELASGAHRLVGDRGSGHVDEAASGTRHIDCFAHAGSARLASRCRSQRTIAGDPHGPAAGNWQCRRRKLAGVLAGGLHARPNPLDDHQRRSGIRGRLSRAAQGRQAVLSGNRRCRPARGERHLGRTGSCRQGDVLVSVDIRPRDVHDRGHPQHWAEPYPGRNSGRSGMGVPCQGAPRLG